MRPLKHISFNKKNNKIMTETQSHICNKQIVMIQINGYAF